MENRVTTWVRRWREARAAEHSPLTQAGQATRQTRALQRRAARRFARWLEQEWLPLLRARGQTLEGIQGLAAQHDTPLQRDGETE